MNSNDTPELTDVQLLDERALPAGYLFCDGRELPIGDYMYLYSRLGTTYGGDGVKTFALPDYREKERDHPGRRYAIGVSFVVSKAEPTTYLDAERPEAATVEAALAIWRTLPSSVCLVPFPFIPKGCAPCDGRILEVSAAPGLFAVLGARFGGDGARTFMTPDLRALHQFCGAIPVVESESDPDEDLLGTIRPLGSCRHAAHYLPCDGASLQISQHAALYALVGNAYDPAPPAPSPAAAERQQPVPWWKRWLRGTPPATPRPVFSHSFHLPDLRALESLSGGRYAICIAGVFPERQ